MVAFQDLLQEIAMNQQTQNAQDGQRRISLKSHLRFTLVFLAFMTRLSTWPPRCLFQNADSLSILALFLATNPERRPSLIPFKEEESKLGNETASSLGSQTGIASSLPRLEDPEVQLHNESRRQPVSLSAVAIGPTRPQEWGDS